MTTNVPPNWFYDTLPQDLLVFSFVSKLFFVNINVPNGYDVKRAFFSFSSFFVCVCLSSFQSVHLKNNLNHSAMSRKNC